MTGSNKETAKTEKRQRGLRGWFADVSPVVVATWVGVFAYFVTRLGQTSFYSKFGLEPEDVGLGYAETLSRAAVGLLAILLVAAAYTLAGLVVPRRTLGILQGERTRVDFAYSLGFFVVPVFAILIVWMPHIYAVDADRVKDGKSVRPAGISTPLRIVTNPLGLRVEPVRVSWIDNTHAAYDFGSKELMYLGRADGIAVFLDPRNQVTVRVPENNIVIERDR